MRTKNNQASLRITQKLLGAVSAFVMAGLLVGCDDATQTSSNPTTQPAVAVVTTQPADATTTSTASVQVAAYPMKPPSVLSIDGHDVAFPPAKLAILSHAAGGYTLRLCSDDPPTAIEPGYVGNSYVLDMRLALDKVGDLSTSSWDFKPTDADDSASGVYLHGYRDQYRLHDVHVAFQKSGEDFITYINGTFLHNDPTNPAAPAERVIISGCVRSEAPAE